MDRSEQVLQYMLRPNVEDCVDLWFGKSAETDREIRHRFGVDVVLAAEGHYGHWARDLDQPRLLVALVILLDQFPRNAYRDTARMYACDARCRDLVRHALRDGAGERLRPIERVLLCLALTHSEALDDQHQCIDEWSRATANLASGDPLKVFGDIFQRHLDVIRRFGRFPHRNPILQRASTAAEEVFLRNSAFRFDLPLIRRQDGAFDFGGACGDCSLPASASAASSASDRSRTSASTCFGPSSFKGSGAANTCSGKYDARPQPCPATTLTH
jgi:uncharacterized protein (DUF924 family)